jgi:FAD/FMN-containing dehydrogenase
MTQTTAFRETTIRELRSSLRGEVLRPGDEGYDAARRVWNGMIDRSPGLIVRCQEVADVVRAVDFARINNLLVAVRGGGHNAAGLAVCDGGLVIDLSPMRRVTVDPEWRTARAQGGATWRDVDTATQAHGLATTGGAISTTGIAGLTLGGGLGWLMRRYGLACDNLLSVEIVTADGQVRTASANDHPDLFWGVRGGGGNFGVVTEFEYRLHPVAEVYGGMMLHPFERAPEVLRAYRELTRSAPDELTAFCGFLTGPDGAPVVATPLCYTGPGHIGAQLAHRLREAGPPIVDAVGPMPYAALQTMLDEGFPAGQQVYWRSDFLDALTDDVIDGLIERFAGVTSPFSAVLIENVGGAVARVGRDETAYDHRDAQYNLAVIARWTEPAERDRHVQWSRELCDAMRSHARGVYVNYLGVDEGADRVREAYGPDKYARLAALKRSYDPTNLFRLNQNIPPAA